MGANVLPGWSALHRARERLRRVHQHTLPAHTASHVKPRWALTGPRPRNRRLGGGSQPTENNRRGLDRLQIRWVGLNGHSRAICTLHMLFDSTHAWLPLINPF